MSLSNRFLSEARLPDNLLVDHVIFYVCEYHEDQMREVKGDLVRESQVVQHRVDDRVPQLELALFDELYEEHVAVQLESFDLIHVIGVH